MRPEYRRERRFPDRDLEFAVPFIELPIPVTARVEFLQSGAGDNIAGAQGEIPRQRLRASPAGGKRHQDGENRYDPVASRHG